MELKTLTRILGITQDSVLEHKPLKGADVLLVDLKREPTLQRDLRRPTQAMKDSRLWDLFRTECELPGDTRRFVADNVDKYRDERWSAAGGSPVWHMRVEVYAPGSAFSTTLERITFSVAENLQGIYDLATGENDPATRPVLMYSLGHAMDDEKMYLVSTLAIAGSVTFDKLPDGPRGARLIGQFSGVRFVMPDCQPYISSSRAGGFDVRFNNGHFGFIGTW